MEKINRYISSLRRDYASYKLDEKNVFINPIQQFNKWMEEAVRSQVNEPNAMTISSVSSIGRPSSRIVLLRGFDESGFTFYTNYNSRKGRELMVHPYTALTFFWPELEKQIRIEGIAEKIPETKSDEYFYSRPRESQLGAWASSQSQNILSRDELEKKYERLHKMYENKKIPRPPYWGGINIKPDYFEFWQGRANRLHDRISYTLVENNWVIKRLAP